MTFKPWVWRLFVPVLVICHAVMGGKRALGDAIVPNKAMTAGTIAEILIESDAVRVNLEIGAEGILAFKNLLPQEIHDKLKLSGEKHENAKERLETFFREDWVIKDENGQPLVGRLNRLAARKRITRDPVTGEPLANQPADAEIVIYVELEFQLGRRRIPSLSIKPPTDSSSGRALTNIGFVTYHKKLPVTDFRYLAGQEIINLDWNDPWYSKFRNRNLRRKFDSPVNVFLYVEPFEVRKEIIVRPIDLQRWIDLGIRSDSVIHVKDQARLKKQVADYLGDKHPVSIDGRPVSGKIDKIHFIRRTLRKTGVVYPDEDLPAMSATLGIIVVYPTETLPEQVTMKWEMFDQRIKMVPASVTDEAGGLPVRLTAVDPELVWKNFLTHPTIPAMRSVPPPQPAKTLNLPIISAICALVGLIAALLMSGTDANRKRLWLVLLVVFVIGAATFTHARVSLANPFVKPAQLSDDECDAIMDSLLHNLYHAFDRHQEELVYDQLAQSLSGDLLSEIYFQTRQRIELADQGGIQVKINEVEIQANELEAFEDGSFSCRCKWRIAGTVGHWGHLHRRGLGFEAKFRITSIDDVWKISSMQITDETEPEIMTQAP